MLNNINVSFFRLLIAINLSVCLLSACQNEKKPILSDQPIAKTKTKISKKKL